MSESVPRRPEETPFKQQRLSAWQPVLSPLFMAVTFSLIALIFIPIGIAILSATAAITELQTEYSDHVCTWEGSPKALVDQHLISDGCEKTFTVVVPKLMKAPIKMYYKLVNFYQNHRRYAKSRSDAQIAGKNATASDLTDCTPLTTTKIQDVEYIYSPCGLMAWSMFNDTAKLIRKTDRSLICDTEKFDVHGTPMEEKMKCEKKGIAWESDRTKKFKSPHVGPNIWTALGDKSSTNFFKQNGYYNNEAGHRIPLATDEDFMVWMRTSALPNFRKLWRKITVDLEPGEYELVIKDRFDISAFAARKYVILATTSWLGGKNNFLGAAYVAVGGLCFVLAISFFIRHRFSGR